KGERRYAPNPRADERKCPGRIGKPPRARRMRIGRQPREEGREGQKAGEKARRPVQRTLGMAHTITITGLAADWTNVYISVRWQRLPKLSLWPSDIIGRAGSCRRNGLTGGSLRPLQDMPVLCSFSG